MTDRPELPQLRPTTVVRSATTFLHRFPPKNVLARYATKNFLCIILRFLMFCCPCMTVDQYSDTNVMHILFSLLRIKGLYMFRTLLAHPQEVLNKRHLVYYMRVANWQHTQYTKCCLCCCPACSEDFSRKTIKLKMIIQNQIPKQS
jgi:hypothetical protein